MKDYRESQSKYLLLLLLFLFILWCTPLVDSLRTVEEDGSTSYQVLAVTLESAVVSGTISLAAFLCDNILGGELKMRMVCLFLFPAPGETVFSRLKDGKIHDKRFLTQDALKVYEKILNDLPRDVIKARNYENAEWYRLYVGQQDKASVVQTHRDFLTCRDLFSQTAVYILFYLLAIAVFPEVVSVSSRFVCLLLAIAALTNLAAQIRMRRFVNTVLAVDIAQRNP